MAWNQSGDDKKKDDKPRDTQKPPELDQLFKDVKDQFSSLLGNKKPQKPGKKNGGSRPATYWLSLFVIGLVAIVAFSGTYQVPEHQRAVVLGYGNQPVVKQPGTHWHNPLWQQVALVNVDAVNHYKLSGEQVTADGKLINVSVDVGYQIGDPVKYVTSLASPVSGLQHLLLASLRQQVGQHSLQQLMANGRETLAKAIKQQLIKGVTAQQTGLLINQVNVQQLGLPDRVDKAFGSLDAIRAQGEQALQAAKQKQAAKIASAKEKTQQLLTQAKAYQKEKVDHAKGDVSRFNSLLASYRKAPQVTRDRLYFDTMEAVLKDTPKVVVMTGNANQLLVPLKSLLSEQAQKTRSSTADDKEKAVNDKATKSPAAEKSEAKADAKPAKKVTSLYDKPGDGEPGL